MIEGLLLKYIAGDATVEEKEAITHWLNTSSENMSRYLALRKLHDAAIWHQLSITPENNSAQEHEKKKNRITRWGLEFLKIAAIFIAVFTYQLFRDNPVTEEPSIGAIQTIFVPAGQRAELTLADGSKVWLNAKTTLIFPDRFEKGHRKVELIGEAYFDVTHDPERPFTVITEKYDIHVLGTEFNVMAYKGSNRFETSLVKGAIDITAHKNKSKITLSSGTKAVRSDGNLNIYPTDDYNHLLWKNGIIYFDDETVSDMVAKLELYYDYTVDIRKKDLSNHKYSGKFNTRDGVEHVFRVLQHKHKFQYTKDDEKKIITIY